MPQTRSTNRKRFIQQILAEAAGTPMVLEELRWRVLQKDLEDEKQPVGTMTESYQKSFNRSLRSFLPTLAPPLRMHKIASDDGWTAGLLARVAVYRLDQYALLERFLSSESVSLHFWVNARTKDVWQEGYDGQVEVQNESLLPENAPNKIEPIHYTRGGWPRSGPNRRRDLAALGPKWKKRPLACVKICTRAIEAPEEGDVLAIIKLPMNLPLSVIGPEPLEEPSLRNLGAVPWALYLRRRRVAVHGVVPPIREVVE
jgi:hypothetical protein